MSNVVFSGSERNRNIVREHRSRNNVVVLNIGASGDLRSSGLDDRDREAEIRRAEAARPTPLKVDNAKERHHGLLAKTLRNRTLFALRELGRD